MFRYNAEIGVEVPASAEDIIRDQNERSTLEKVIADVETALRGATPGTRRILENSLEGMKGRVSSLDKKISEAIKEREVQAREQAAAVAMLVEKETRLNESEKQVYSSFLAEDFFTKKDFGKLDEFYSHSWDRLTEGGKEEMSHRVWESVRHHECEFSDLPKSVQEKEAKLAYAKLTAQTPDSSITKIPEADRNDFVQAYQKGQRRDAYQVLDRDSFRQNMGLKPSDGITHKSAESGKEADDKAVVGIAKGGSEQSSKPTEKSAATARFDDINLDGADVKGVVLADAPSAPNVADMPNASISHVNAR